MPADGLFPVSVVTGELIQIDWVPAVVAGVFGLFTCTVIVEMLLQDKLLVFHWNTFVPSARPVTVEL